VKLFAVLLVVVVAELGAYAQIEARHGTLVVAYLTDKKIAMAAESGTAGEGAEKPDSVCKLAAIDHKLLFATSGVGTLRVVSDPKLGWDNVEEARIAYERASKMSGTVLYNAANIWGRQIALDWNRLYLARRSEMVKKIGDGNTGANAFFAAAVNGAPQLVYVEVTFQPTGEGRAPFAYSVETVPPERCPNHICAIGHGEAVAPYGNLTTDSARKEVNQWSTQVWPGTPDDREVLIAIRLVDLAIADLGNDPHNGLSAPIDALELKGDGSFRWFIRKPACPEN
jgi:hypothetical protein